MTTKHTPGPWGKEYCGKDTIKIFKVSDERRIATVKIRSMEMDEGNAALIAAAPDLLAACEEVLKAANDPDYDDYFDGARIEVMLERAIAKAKGSAS